MRWAHPTQSSSIEKSQFYRKKATYMFSRILSGIWNLLLFFQILLLESISAFQTFLPLAQRQCSHSGLTSHPCCSTGQTLQNTIQVPMKSFNLLKQARAQVQHIPPEPTAHHSFPLLCWAPTHPCGFPRTWYSSFLFNITPRRGSPLLFGFKWLGDNAERRK